MPRIVSVMQANAAIEELDEKYNSRLTKLEAFVEDMQPWADILGFYKTSGGQELPCIIGRVFPQAGTLDAVVIDVGGSGGILEVSGVSLGDGKEQVRRIMRLEEIKEPEAQAEKESDESNVAA